MKIHFSNVNFSSSSGPNSFASRLANQLVVDGHDIVGCNDRYDAALVFIEPSTKLDRNAQIVQRLDGIWFNPEQFKTHNAGIKRSYDNSDHVIWQSDFDKKMICHHWGNKEGTVIHNGISLNKVKIADFNLTKLREKYDKIFVSSASWHRQKRLKENVQVFLQLKKKHAHSCMIIMGKNPDYQISHPDIFYTGQVSHDKCLEIYAASDWMIHMAWLDHCPNVVVEAISQNCAVICSSSGGTKEIVSSNGLVIQENNPYNFELTDYDSPYMIEIPSIDLPDLKIDNSYLDIKIVSRKYANILKGEGLWV